MFKGVSAQDWISLAVGALGFLTAVISRNDRLPAWARKWLKRIGKKRIVAAIESAASIATRTPAQRREVAITYLQKVAIRDLGIRLPASIANLLVEHIYQEWKRRVRK